MITSINIRQLAPSVLAIAFIFVVSFLSCSDDTNPTSANSTDKKVDEYLEELPPWSEFSPEMASSDTISGEGDASKIDLEGVTYDCSTTPYTITETPDKIVTLDPDANIL